MLLLGQDQPSATFTRDCFLAGNQQVSSAGSGQREGITEGSMWGQDKSAIGQARSNQDAQESQAWDKESLCCCSC